MRGLLCAALLLAGCGPTSQPENAARRIITYGRVEVIVWVDPGTSCQYVTTLYGNGVSTVPRAGTPCPAARRSAEQSGVAG